MPRYFFDTRDGTFSHRDVSGQELDNLSAARHAALSTLPSMADEHIPDIDNGTFTVSVRDEMGRIVYAAELTLKGQWGPLARH